MTLPFLPPSIFVFRLNSLSLFAPSHSMSFSVLLGREPKLGQAASI